MAKRAKNLLRDDPTHTVTLRNRAVGETTRRYGEIKRLITESVVKNKVFVENARPLTKDDFIFLRQPEKLERFDVWLKSVVDELILSGDVAVNSINLNWMLEYFKESYSRGVKKANNEMARVIGRNQIPIRPDVFAVPFHVEKVQLLFARDFAQLKGITEAMSQQMNRVLAQGLLTGESPRTIARLLNDRVDKIGRTRSILLARTEIVNAHNLGKIMEGKALSDILGEEVVYLWQDSNDGKVRPEHVFRDGKYYSFARILTLIGEPNCRCAVTSTPISAVPEGATVIR